MTAISQSQFELPRLGVRALIALAIMALAVPVYALHSYEGTLAISMPRWLAFHLLIAEILVVLTALISGWNIRTSWQRLPRNMQWAGLGWIVTATLATSFAARPGFSTMFQGAWIVHGLFAWSLWSMLSTKWRSMQPVLLALFAVSLLFHSALVYAVTWVILEPDFENWAAYLIGINNPRIYIFYACALLGLGLGFLIASKDAGGKHSVSDNRRLFCFALLLTFAAYHLFAFAGGRNSLGVSLIVPVIAAAMAPRQAMRILGVAFVCAAIAYPMSLYTAPSHPLYGFGSIWESMAYEANSAIPSGYTSGRLQMWEAMIAQGFDRPIFGHGQIGTLAGDESVRQKAGMAIHPHNSVVHIWHAWGVAGLAIFALALLPFMKSIPARLKANPLVAWPAFLILVAHAAASMLDGTLFYNQSLFFCSLAIAILASVPKRSAAFSQLAD